MKICIITSLFTPYKRGGAEVIAQKTVEKLARAGHEVVVISHGYTDLVETVEGVKVYRISAHNIFSYIDIGKKPLWLRAIWHLIDQWNFTNAKRVREIVDLEKPDRVIVHAIKGLSYLLPKYLQTYDKQVVFTLHDIQLAIPSGLLILNHEKDFLVNNPFNWMFEYFSKYLFSFAKIIVTPSNWLMDFYKTRGFFKSNKTLVIRNPIDLSRQYHEKSFNYKYAFIGQVEEHKGIRLLCNSFEKFMSKYPQAELLIVGGGTLKDELDKKYQGTRIKFLGFVPYDQLNEKVFKDVAYSLLTSTCYENSPGTVYDGFANSTPVIVPAIGGSAELVTEGVNGFVFKPGDEADLLRVLELTVSTRDNYLKMTKNAFEAIQPYGFDKYLNNILGLS